MADYNFWADLLFTFQTSPDWIKALWLLVPPTFILALISMMIRFGQSLIRHKNADKPDSRLHKWHRSEAASEMPRHPDLIQEIETLIPLLNTEEQRISRS